MTRHTYDLQFKKKALYLADEIGITDAARALNLDYNLLYKWKRKEDEIKKQKRIKRENRPKTPMKELREAANLTQKQFAEYLGVSLRSLRSWEQASRRPIQGLEGLVYRLMVAENVISKDAVK